MNSNLLTVKHLLSLLALVTIVTLTSCSSAIGPSKPNPLATSALKAVFINPHTSGTYEHFTAGTDYPKTYNVYKNTELLAKTNSSNSKVIIDLSLQRGFLMNGDQVVMDYPVATGNSRHPTPTGSFRILEKTVDKRSNLYGKMLDADGKVTNYDADSRDDTIPEGGSFLGASMAYWMRLTGDGVGMHRGKVPRYPASHGCIRTPGSVVTIVFKKVRKGTTVIVQR
jgi:lipoprotein-anchoring transpeptidase ErfK/SrfK